MIHSVRDTIGKSVPIVFYFTLFVLFVTSCGLWVGWGGRSKYIYGISIIILIFSILGNRGIEFEINKKNILVSLVLCIVTIVYEYEIRITHFGIFFLYFIICCLKKTHQIQCLILFYKWFAWLMFPSIIVYFLVHAGLIPAFGTLNLDDGTHGFWDASYTIRSNYLFYCYAPSFYDIRFNGPFAEPGHLGAVISFLIYANGFNFKKSETFILLGGLILTMSLTGYMLTYICYMFYKFEQNEMKLFPILIFLLGTMLFYLFGTMYNGGDNFINDKILNRLVYDEEKGFHGNNRVFGMVDLYFASMFNNEHTLLFGYDTSTIDYLKWHNSRGTGITYVMISKGLVGTIAGIMFYIVYSMSVSKNRKIAFMFLFYICILYWIGAYTFWLSTIMCYVFGITTRNFIDKNENRNFDISLRL